MTMTNDQEAKSLGEKLYDAMAPNGEFIATWAALSDTDKTRVEKFALAFVASLSQDEEKAALILRAQAAERQRDGYQLHLRQAEQIAGQALGYPWFKDDQANFPGATDADGVCIGDHIGDTIVAELADTYKGVKAERDALREALTPFSAQAADVGSDETDSDTFANSRSPYRRAHPITVGDIRQAARALQTKDTDR